MSRIASREPAEVRITGRLSRADLLWVANTAHGPGGHWHARPRAEDPDHDHLESASSAIEYLVAHGVPVPDGFPDAASLSELGVVRNVLGRLAEGIPDALGDDGSAFLSSARWTIAPDGRVASVEPGWRGFARDLLVPLVALLEEDARPRRCSNPACRLLFVDASRNHGRRWCDTAGCGNRFRVRRARTAGARGSGVGGEDPAGTRV